MILCGLQFEVRVANGGFVGPGPLVLLGVFGGEADPEGSALFDEGGKDCLTVLVGY